MRTKWCNRCEAFLPVTAFNFNKGKKDGLSSFCYEHMLEVARESYWKRRRIFIEEMGGKCVRCEITDIRVLNTDHVNGGGQEEQRIMGCSTSPKFYKHVLAHRNEYQLLCANCNMIKRLEEKEATGPKTLIRRIPA